MSDEGRQARAAAVAAMTAVTEGGATLGEALPRLLPLGPEVTIDDGILDVVVLKADGFWSAALVVWQLFRRRETDRVQRIRGTEVRVESPDPHVVQADGEICGTTPFSASIVPASLTVMTP